MLLKQLDEIFGAALRWFCILALAALTVVLSGVVANRFIDPSWIISNPGVLQALKLGWADEVVEWLMSAMIFVGAAALHRERSHFKVEFLLMCLGDGYAGRIARLVIELITGVFIVAFAWFAFDLMAGARRASPYLVLPMAYWYAPMVFAGVAMTIYSIRDVVGAARRLIPVADAAQPTGGAM
jgi:TRAP-type C4-dicarboxylate transport system permease small subunit